MLTIEHEVVIIGAGMAGLAAGQRLRQAGVPALLLEARNRVGGRVWTDRTRGIVEFGAEFIHGKKAVTWELIHQAGLATKPRPSNEDETYLYAHHGRLLKDSELDARVQRLYHLAEQYEGQEQSLADFINSLAPPDDLAAQFALRRLANVENSDVSRQSVQAMANERRLYSAGWGDDFHIVDGYDSVAALLAQELNIHLNTAVTRIEWTETGATLFLSNAQTSGRAGLL